MQGVPWYRWQHQEPGDRSAALPPLPGQNYQPGPGIGTEVLIAGDVFEFLAGLRSRPPFGRLRFRFFPPCGGSGSFAISRLLNVLILATPATATNLIIFKNIILV